MIDARMRAAERRAAQDGTPQAREAEILARIRAGARDPRRRPSTGDLVENRFGHQRLVYDVWPKVLTEDVGARGARIRRGAVVEAVCPRRGWLYVALRVRSTGARQADEAIWGPPVWRTDLDLPTLPGVIWCVLDDRWANDLEAALVDREEDAPTLVEFRNLKDRVAHGPMETRPLGFWRRWARDGRVLESKA